jgi:hypothetical protein
MTRLARRSRQSSTARYGTIDEDTPETVSARDLGGLEDLRGLDATTCFDPIARIRRIVEELNPAKPIAVF